MMIVPCYLQIAAKLAKINDSFTNSCKIDAVLKILLLALTCWRKKPLRAKLYWVFAKF